MIHDLQVLGPGEKSLRDVAPLVEIAAHACGDLAPVFGKKREPRRIGVMESEREVDARHETRSRVEVVQIRLLVEELALSLAADRGSERRESPFDRVTDGR